MATIKGWTKDRDEPNHITYWASGYGLRRGFIEIKRIGQISAKKNAHLWFVDIYKNQGYYEDPKRLKVRTFKTKKSALDYTQDYMRKHPRG